MSGEDHEPLVCDAMLGRLTTYLRMCGYDAVYAPDRGVETDREIAELVDCEGRILLTRDADLAAQVPDSVLLTATAIDDQLQELQARGFRLSLSEPTRCSTCNGSLDRIQPDATTPEHTPDASDVPVWRCQDCGQHYWQGSHWDDVADRLAGLSDG